ncbi:LOG family protein [Nocardioides sp.]|uniref:LOG family protein n=1 Tax=Nocardioides sp. TaxID=35761 RepID=UPI003517FFD5
MHGTRGRPVRISSGEELAQRLDAAPAAQVDAATWQVSGVDLAPLADRLLGQRLEGTTFLGCPGDDDLLTALRAAGALVLPVPAGVPLDPDRRELYTPAELYDGPEYPAYPETLDARVYAWTQQPRDRDATRVAALHDHGIDEALRAWAAPRRLVGVMGGHAAERGTPGYREAALLGAAVARTGAVVATGGGPGAMEAASLGARLGSLDETDAAARLDDVLAHLAPVPSFRPSIEAWAVAGRAARAALDDVPPGPGVVGIPTWFYGHEPPHVMADVVAKYVSNAVREAVLVELCTAGIVVLPGAAGTVQEIFQDACEGYYSSGDTADVPPLVLLGREYWTRTLPAWPLLEALGRGRAFGERIAVVDTIAEAIAVLTR